MNTPAHLAFGLAAFGQPGAARVTVAALLGAFLPDASLYAMAGWHLFVLGTPPETVFGELYFSPLWQLIFGVDNSVFVWGFVLALGLAARVDWLWAMAGAALLHIAFDLPLHHDDGRRHFWPVSDWVFVSPVSYWDSAHGARWVAPIEGAAVLACVIYIWRRFAEAWVRIAAVAIGLLQIAPLIVWRLMF